MPAIHVVLAIEVIHRTAEAARTTRRLAEKLGHAGVRAGATGERVGVIAVGRYQIIIRPRRGDRAADDGFLSNVKMAEAADLLCLILLTRALLETPDQQHQREHLDLVALLRLRHGRVR